MGKKKKALLKKIGNFTIPPSEVSVQEAPVNRRNPSCYFSPEINGKVLVLQSHVRSYLLIDPPLSERTEEGYERAYYTYDGRKIPLWW